MDEFLVLFEPALVWLTDHASVVVAAGSSLLALVLLVMDSRMAATPDALNDAPDASPVEATRAIEPDVEVAPEVSEVTTEVVSAEEVAARVAPAVAVEPEPDAEPADEPPSVVKEEVALESEPVRVSLRERLAKTSQNLVGRLGKVLGTGTVDKDVLSELEDLLFTADLGVTTAENLLETVRRKAMGEDASRVREVLREAIVEKLSAVETAEPHALTDPGPHVILVLGVNGSGKTTTIGKLAAQYVRAGKKVVLGAGDTFRAAAAEQLQIWGDRAGAEVIVGKEGGDPAAVAFDTVKAAIGRNADVCIIDTAGRLQTQKPLMEELGKINRIISRDLPDAPHECLLVLDSNTGQNAISQAKLFTEVASVTGLVLTKLDGTAKGGVIVGLADEFAIPVRNVGVGEGIEDLREFHAEEFVSALFEED